ncbi:hypothetical protein [Paenibacillus sp. 1001270B_150601_E10]|uniref:hypothetical protein n=1 Tax=Paenibacillus sp. 1001270B_150601_E10 TaxID=2787079 RepID=UPI001E53C9A6|nr:hypothetical protein [Paenibacillus sp. 1001270B_150601_E10]
MKNVFYTKTFWERYFWKLQDEFTYDTFEDNPIHFQLTAQDALLLDPGEDFAYISLGYQHKDEEEIEIAWDDEAHFHPFVMRCHEYQAIVNQISAEHQLEAWIPALLLRRFVGVGDFAEFQMIMAWELDMRKASGLFTEAEMQDWLEESKQWDEDYWNGCNATWKYQERYGWVYEGEDAYSLRNSANPSFPFLKWNRMLAELGCLHNN